MQKKLACDQLSELNLTGALWPWRELVPQSQFGEIGGGAVSELSFVLEEAMVILTLLVRESDMNNVLHCILLYL